MLSFYATVKARGLEGRAHQWRSLVACGQERLVYAKALEQVRRDARCLDWGCGNGHFSYFLAAQGYRPDAFALTEKPALLNEMPDIAFTAGTHKTTLPYATSTFDAVFALGVIEHVAEHGGDEAASLAELARVLKPGGLLLVFHLPNRWSWIEWAKWTTWRLGLTQTREHVRRFTRASFLEFLRPLPFEVVGAGRYHFLPRATLGRVPMLRDAPGFASLLNVLDDGISQILGGIAQNYYFVLRKRGMQRSMREE